MKIEKITIILNYAYGLVLNAVSIIPLIYMWIKVDFSDLKNPSSSEKQQFTLFFLVLIIFIVSLILIGINSAKLKREFNNTQGTESLKARINTQSTTEKHCPKCGVLNSANNNYCTNCCEKLK